MWVGGTRLAASQGIIYLVTAIANSPTTFLASFTPVFGDIMFFISAHMHF